MELDIFISTTLQDIIKGINTAQEFAIENGSIINPPIEYFHKTATPAQNIEFDIALTVTNEQKSDIGGKINIAGFGIGSKVNDLDTNQTVSRIKFNVPVVFRMSKT